MTQFPKDQPDLCCLIKDPVTNILFTQRFRRSLLLTQKTARYLLLIQIKNKVSIADPKKQLVIYC